MENHFRNKLKIDICLNTHRQFRTQVWHKQSLFKSCQNKPWKLEKRKMVVAMETAEIENPILSTEHRASLPSICFLFPDRVLMYKCYPLNARTKKNPNQRHHRKSSWYYKNKILLWAFHNSLFVTCSGDVLVIFLFSSEIYTLKIFIVLFILKIMFRKSLKRLFYNRKFFR